MNTHSIYRLFAIAMLATANVACESSALLDEGQGEGVLGLNISIITDGDEMDAMRSTSSDDDAFDYSKALSNSVMKIYNADGRLIRRYEPISEAPESIYLTAGNYSVSITAGEWLTPSVDQADITFEGSSDFTITAAETTEVSVDCAMVNNTVAVIFSDSIISNMEEGYEVVVAPASEIDATILSSSYKNKMHFTATGGVYFIAPEGVTDLAWRFTGVRKLSMGEQVIKSGVINDVKAGEYNALTFSYDKELGLSGSTITVDPDEDRWEDDFIFKPQATILGVDFDITQTQVADGRSFTVSIEAAAVIDRVEVICGNTIVTPMVDGEAVSVTGAQYVAGDNPSKGEVTIDNDFFANVGAGGAQSITVKITEQSGTEGEKSFNVETSGITSFSNYDFWNNTANLSASIVDPALSTSTIGIEYRSVGSETWRTYSTTTTDSQSYTSSVEAYWSSAKSNEAGKTYYTLEEGISPSKEYECRMVVDGVARPSIVVTTAATDQVIPYGNMDDGGLSCWGSSNSGSTSWGSGNNDFAKTLCVQTQRGDAKKCALLSASETKGIIAAGNIFLGQFKFNGISAQTGTVSFGQPFTWKARPKSLKLRYSAEIGQGNITAPDGTKYTHDRGRIYFAIVDWSGRHTVTAGNGKPSGVWDPATMTSVDKGEIIGYASTYVDASTDYNMHDMELEVHYYDKETNPSSSAISIVLLCTTSAYGDYTTGVSGTKLWLDDFAFGY